MEEEIYSSDTSDEEFTIEKGALTDSDSVVESEEEETEEPLIHANRKKGKTKTKIKNRKSSSDQDETRVPPQETSEKDIKEKAESLWADFLADVDEKSPPPPKPKTHSWAALLENKNKNSVSGKNLKELSPEKKAQQKVALPPDVSNTVKVTKIFEFAGEEVRVEEEVSSESAEAKQAKLNGSPTESSSSKPIGASGVVDFLNKKRKLTTLEKTKLDWDYFKNDEGIKEELESHKKSKSGYLDKQAFLERADLRQFEIERDMRHNRRNKR